MPSCSCRATSRRSSSCTRSRPPANACILLSARRSCSIAAPSNSTGTDNTVRKACNARTFCPALPPSNRVVPCRLRQTADDRDDEDRGARTLVAEADGRPEHERQRQIEQRGNETRRDRAGTGAERERACADEAGQHQHHLDATAARQCRRRGAEARPRHEHRAECRACQRVGAVPVRPGHPIAVDLAVAQQRHERAAERADSGADDHGDQDIGDRLPQRAEPVGSDHEAANAVCIEHGHRAIRHESDQQLDRPHADPDLRHHVRRKCRRDAQPPASPGDQQQGAEENDVGWPERCEDAVGQCADIERGLGAEIIRQRENSEREDRCRFQCARLRSLPNARTHDRHPRGYSGTACCYRALTGSYSQNSTDLLGVASWFSGIPFETKAGFLASAYDTRGAMDQLPWRDCIAFPSGLTLRHLEETPEARGYSAILGCSTINRRSPIRAGRRDALPHGDHSSSLYGYRCGN